MSDESKKNEDKTPGIVSWNELISRDPAGSKKFYTEMFGWTAEEMPMPTGTYTFFRSGDRPAAGMIQLPPDAGEMPTMWMGYITVSDLEAAVEKARGLGARICKEITEMPMGSFAVVIDPQGATFGLWRYAD